MKERPILFSAPMVLATLAGQKTMTRRVISPRIVRNWDPPRGREDIEAGYPFISWGPNDEYIPVVKICPHGQPGDLLWVKETWRIGAWNEDGGRVAVDYKADGYCRKEWLDVGNTDLFEKLWAESAMEARRKFGLQEFYRWEPGNSPCRWRPSIFLPRWASRISLEITNVRVERLQDISEEDAYKEGINRELPGVPAYHALWDMLNKKRGFGWDTNPPVWAIEFKRIKDN